MQIEFSPAKYNLSRIKLNVANMMMMYTYIYIAYRVFMKNIFYFTSYLLSNILTLTTMSTTMLLSFNYAAIDEFSLLLLLNIVTTFVTWAAYAFDLMLRLSKNTCNMESIGMWDNSHVKFYLNYSSRMNRIKCTCIRAGWLIWGGWFDVIWGGVKKKKIKSGKSIKINCHHHYHHRRLLYTRET